MEGNYGIKVTNKYALFLGEEGGDPSEALALAQAQEAAKASKSSGKENKDVSKGSGPQAGQKGKTTTVGGKTAKETLSTAAKTTPVPPKDARTTNNNNRGGNKVRDGNNNPSGKTSTTGKIPAAASSTVLPASGMNEGSVKKTKREGTSGRPFSGPKGSDAQQNNQLGFKRDRPTDGNRVNRDRPPRNNGPRDNNRPPRGDRPVRDNNNVPGEGGEAGNRPEGDRRPPRRFPRNDERGPLQSNNNPNFSAAGPNEANPEERGNRGRVFRGGNRGPRAGGRGGGPRGEGFRGGFEGNRDGRGKPVYDRHSGSVKSGIKAVDKRDGAGPHNWGNIEDDLAGQQGDTSVNAAEGQAVSSGEENNAADGVTAGDATVAAVDGEGTEGATPASDEPKEMTLDEYKRMMQTQQQKRQKPKLGIRKPGEGQDTSQWENTYLLNKKDKIEEEFAGIVEEEEEYEEVEIHVENREKKKKVIDIDIHFKDTFNRDRGGRGFRGRDRPDRDRGGDRPPRDANRPPRGDRPAQQGGGGGGRGFGRNKQAAPKVDDVNDFPSLGVAA